MGGPGFAEGENSIWVSSQQLSLIVTKSYQEFLFLSTCIKNDLAEFQEVYLITSCHSQTKRRKILW